MESVVVKALAVSPNGTHLAAGGKDGVVRLLRWSEPTSVSMFLGHRGFVESLAFTPDGNWLVSGDDWDDVRFWRVPLTESQRKRFISTHRSWRGHKDWISEIAFHPNRNIFATAGHDERVHVWDSRDGRRIDSFIFDTWVSSVAFSPSGSVISMTGVTSSESFLWIFNKHERIESIGYSLHSAFHPSGRWFAKLDLALRVFQYPSMTGLSVANTSDSELDVDFAWAHESPMVAFAESNGRVRLGRIEGDEVTWQELLAPSRRPFQSCEFSPGDELLVLGDSQGCVHWFDLRRGELAQPVRVHSGPTVVTFSPDGTQLATAGQEGTIKLWDVPTRRHRLTLKTSPAGITCIDFSADGQILAAGGQDGMVDFWRAATKGKVETSNNWVREQYLSSESPTTR